MYFSLSDYKERTQNLKVCSRGDATGLFLSRVERWFFTRASRFWRANYKPRMEELDTVKQLLVVPPPLGPEHVARCRMYEDRNAMIESLDKGKVWAEVGTFEGAFAKKILETCEPAELHLIDIDFSRVKKAGNISEGQNVRFCQGDSATRLKQFPDKYFDYIYIDAGHDLIAVARDVDAARPKLKDDGVLLFNDYIVYSHRDQLPFGVVPVVNSLCNEDGWTIVGFALHPMMYCDVALRRIDPAGRRAACG